LQLAALAIAVIAERSEFVALTFQIAAGDVVEKQARRLAAGYERQVIAHEIDRDGRKQKKHSDQETPITMSASPSKGNRPCENVRHPPLHAGGDGAYFYALVPCFLRKISGRRYEY
jgi:hypothetical protein